MKGKTPPKKPLGLRIPQADKCLFDQFMEKVFG